MPESWVSKVGRVQLSEASNSATCGVDLWNCLASIECDAVNVDEGKGCDGSVEANVRAA